MSNDNIRDTWYLTSQGWVEGDSPPDYLLERTYREYTPGSSMKTSYGMEEKVNTDYEENLIREALEKYGKHPNEGCAFIAMRARNQ